MKRTLLKRSADQSASRATLRTVSNPNSRRTFQPLSRVIFAPELASLRGVEVIRSLDRSQGASFWLAFVTAQDEVDRLSLAIVSHTEAAGTGDPIVWFAFVKGSSKPSGRSQQWSMSSVRLETLRTIDLVVPSAGKEGVSRSIECVGDETVKLLLGGPGTGRRIACVDEHAGLRPRGLDRGLDRDHSAACAPVTCSLGSEHLPVP